MVKQFDSKIGRRWIVGGAGLILGVLAVVGTGLGVSAGSVPRGHHVGGAVSRISNQTSRVSADAGLICGPEELTLSGQFYNVDMSGSYEIYQVTNIGSTPCSLGGSPIFAAQNAQAEGVETISETFSSAAGSPVATSAGTPVDLEPGSTGSFAVWWQNCPDPIPSAKVSEQDVTTSWTFAGQQAGVTQEVANFAAGCPALPMVVSALQLGVMAGPPWLPAPSAGSPPVVQP